MPTLKQLQCLVKCPVFSEHGVEYGDGEVDCFLRVPNKPTSFCIQLKSQGYIASGLAMFVYVDGVYACNRNRTNLRFANPDDPASVQEIDFTVRQMEKSQENGNMWSRPWAFEKIRPQDREKAEMKAEASQDNKTWGIIEVIVRRCHVRNGPYDIISAFGPSPDPAMLRLRPKTGAWKHVYDDQDLIGENRVQVKQKASFGYDGADEESAKETSPNKTSPKKKTSSDGHRSESRKPRSRTARSLKRKPSSPNLRDSRKASKQPENASKPPNMSSKSKDPQATNRHGTGEADPLGSATKVEESPSQDCQENSAFPPRPATPTLRNSDSPEKENENPKKDWGWTVSPQPSFKSLGGWGNPDAAEYPEPLHGAWEAKPLDYHSVLNLPQSESPTKMSEDQVRDSKASQRRRTNKLLTHYVAKDRPARYTHSQAKPTYIDSMEEPYARFVFRYRDKSAIEKALNIVIDDFETTAKQECANKTRDDLIAELISAKKLAKKLRREKEQAEQAAKWSDSSNAVNPNDLDEYGFVKGSLGQKISHLIRQVQGKEGGFSWGRKKYEADDSRAKGWSDVDTTPKKWPTLPKSDKAEQTGNTFESGQPAATCQWDWNQDNQQQTAGDTARGSGLGGTWNQSDNANGENTQSFKWGGSSDRKSSHSKKEYTFATSPKVNNESDIFNRGDKDTDFQNNPSQERASSPRSAKAQVEGHPGWGFSDNTDRGQNEGASDLDTQSQHSPKAASGRTFPAPRENEKKHSPSKFKTANEPSTSATTDSPRSGRAASKARTAAGRQRHASKSPRSARNESSKPDPPSKSPPRKGWAFAWSRPSRKPSPAPAPAASEKSGEAKRLGSPFSFREKDKEKDGEKSSTRKRQASTSATDDKPNSIAGGWEPNWEPSAQEARAFWDGGERTSEKSNDEDQRADKKQKDKDAFAFGASKSTVAGDKNDHQERQHEKENKGSEDWAFTWNAAPKREEDRSGDKKEESTGWGQGWGWGQNEGKSEDKKKDESQGSGWGPGEEDKDKDKAKEETRGWARSREENAHQSKEGESRARDRQDESGKHADNGNDESKENENEGWRGRGGEAQGGGGGGGAFEW